MRAHRLVLLALMAAACGRESSPARLRSGDPDAPSGGGGGGEGGAFASGGASVQDAGPPDATAANHDASVEGGATDGAVEDAVTSGPTIDCACPGGPYDVTIATDHGQTYVLTEPYPLSIYCAETAPMAAGLACAEIWRLSACSGASYGPPCIYFGVNLVKGPLLGHFVDVDGTTRDLVDVSLTVASSSNGTATGDFVAAFSTTGMVGPITVTGSFRACNPLIGGCSAAP